MHEQLPPVSSSFNPSIEPSTPEDFNHMHLIALAERVEDAVNAKFLPAAHGIAFLEMDGALYHSGIPSTDAKIVQANRYLRYYDILQYCADSIYLEDILIKEDPLSLPATKITLPKNAKELRERGLSSTIAIELLKHNYSLELNDSKTVLLTEKEGNDLLYPNAPAGRYECTEIITAMRARGDKLPEKSLLDEQFRHIVALLGCDLKMTAAAHLAQFAKRAAPESWRMAQAQNFFREYQETFGQDDLMSDMQMVRRLANMISTYSRDTSYGSEFNGMANYLRKTVVDKEKALNMLKTIYDAHGWERPIIFEQQPPSPAQPPTKEVTSSPLEDETLRQQEEFIRTCETYGAQWQFKAIPASDRSKFKELIRDLVQGYHQGELMLDGMDKNDARQVIGVLSRLATTVHESSTEKAHRSLQNDLMYEQKLRQDLHNFNTWKLPATPQVFPLYRHLNHIKSAWSVYRHVLASWPLPLPVGTITKLETMLHYDAEAQKNHTNSTERLGQIAAAAVPHELRNTLSAAQILQEVILPPQPTERDIQEVINQGHSVVGERSKPIRWDRLHDLVRLQRENNGQLYTTEKILGSQAYFIVVFALEGYTYAIAEPLLPENATYIVDQSATAGNNWLDVLTKTKFEAQALGSYRLFHTQEDGRRSHFDRICDLLIEIHSRNIK